MEGVRPDNGISSLFRLQSTILKSGGILELLRRGAIMSKEGSSTMTSAMANMTLKTSSRSAALVDLVQRGLGRGNNIDVTA